MDTHQQATATWRYYVSGGKVFCPQRTADIDVHACSNCVYLNSDPAASYIVCLPPDGNSLADMIDTVAKY